MTTYAINETYETQGEWYLPDIPERRVHGKLTFSSDGGQLELAELLTQSESCITTYPTKETVTYSVIHGVSSKGEAITILQGLQSGRSMNMSSGGFRLRERIHCNKLIIGAWIPPDFLLNYVAFRIPSLQVWSGQKVIEESHEYADQRFRQSFNIQSPPKNSISLPEKNFEIEFHLCWSNQSDSFLRIAVDVFAWMGIRSEIGQTLDWYLEQRKVLATLICLLAAHPMSPDAISVEVPYVKGDISLLVALVDSDTCRIENPSEFFLTKKSLEPHFKTILRNWFGLYETAKSAAQLTMSVMSSNTNWLHVQFLSLMQALEGLHRSFFDGRFTSPEKYEHTRQALLSAIPSDLDASHRESLKSRIKYGYEFSLARRLKDLVGLLPTDIAQHVLGGKGVPRSWIETRNYYTHWDEFSKKNVLESDAMYYANQRLTMFLRLCFLATAGATPNQMWAGLGGDSRTAQQLLQMNDMGL